MVMPYFLLDITGTKKNILVRRYMLPLKHEIRYFMNYLVIFYNNENGPVKYTMIDHSTLSLITPIPCNTLTTPVKARENPFYTLTSHFIK